MPGTSTDIEQYLIHKKAFKQYFLPPIERVLVDGFEAPFEGTLQTILPKLHQEPFTTIVLVTRNLFLQIGKLLEKLIAQKYRFMQFDLSTFHFYQNHLGIADTSSLRAAYSQYNQESLDVCSESKTTISTPPSETFQRAFVEKWHARLFAKCLYQFISGHPLHEWSLTDNEDMPLSFEYPIFKTTEGRVFQNIIVQLLNINNGGEMTLHGALALIKNLNPIFIQKKECAYSVLNSIKELIGERVELNEFIQDYQSKINSATPGNIHALIQDLQKLELVEEIKQQALKIEILSLLDKIEKIQPVGMDAPESGATPQQFEPMEPEITLEVLKKKYNEIKDGSISKLEPFVLELRQQNAAANPAPKAPQLSLSKLPGDRCYYTSRRVRSCESNSMNRNHFFPTHKMPNTRKELPMDSIVSFHLSSKPQKEEKESVDVLSLGKALKHTLSFKDSREEPLKKGKSSGNISSGSFSL